MGMMALSTGVSFLFVPATRLDRLPKALATAASMVVIDLEDAVDPDQKIAARSALERHFMAAQHAVAERLLVRINAAGTHWHEDDLATIGRLGVGVMLPKAEDCADLERIRAVAGPERPVCALVETALGIERASAMARSGLTTRLAFGSLDYAADVGCAVSQPALLHARSQLVLASRLGDLAAPIDGVTDDFRNEALNRLDAQHAIEMGFGGKLCIHPDQVGWVHAAMMPSADEIKWARKVLAADGAGAVAIDGVMVDAPVRKRATLMLERARVGQVSASQVSA